MRILEIYAKQNGFSNLRWYTDDGYSGANFQRSGFQAMLADIEAGTAGTVNVKDMSRLGHYNSITICHQLILGILIKSARRRMHCRCQHIAFHP